MTGSDVAIKGDPADEHEDDFEDAHHDPASGSQSPVAADSANKSSLPMQKRRRVTRACDECRRKKIKCDGKQPCTHCTVYSYDCTYDQPSNRRRNPVPAYVEALEARVHRAEGLIQMIAPNLDLNDPALDIAVRHGYIPGLKSAVPGQHENPTTPSSRPPHSQPDDLSADKNETNLESMIRAVGLLDMDENGNWDYHGHSSGLSFVRRMREQLGDLMGPDTGTTPFIKSRPVSNVLDSPKSASIESPVDPLNPTSDLPPEHQARDLCAFAINMSSVVLRVVHVPSFWSSLGRIYSLPAHQFTNDDHKFFPLLYAVLAVGCVYGSNDDATYDTAIDRGFRYFKIARQMMDIADIRDMTSIQAVLFMILFLQCSARLSQCYSYIGVALRAAVRMGLHRSLPQKRFNPLELEMRKRVFWTIRKLDVYVGAMLGLPHTLTEDDIDQEDPVEVDDEHITETGITPMPPGTVTLMTAFNYHRRLLTILNKIVREVYPIHVRNSGPAAKSYTVSFSTIKDIEQQMEEWKASLPQGLDPSHDDPKLFRLQAALRVTYAFNQVLLYRPFLHFVGRSKRSEHSDQRAYACAASYINVSRNLIHICDQTNRRGSLGSSLWFTVYLTFFSILSLVYFAAENPDNETTQDIIKDALHGKAILSSAARRSMSADRCAATLDIIFKSLPQWIREGRQNPNPAPPKRKRKQVTEPRPSLVTQSAATPRALPPNIKLDPSATQSPATVMAGLSQVGVANDGQYTPQNAGFGAFTPTDYSPTTQTLQRFGLQQPSGNLDVQDLSSMMFSSAEPFTYPNQPLTTFEENNRNARGSQFYGTGRDSDLISMNGTGTPNSATVDGLEAQLYNGAPFALPGVNWPSDMQNMQHGSMGTQAHQQQQQHQQPLPQYQHPQYVVSQPPAMSQNWQQQRYPTQENERQVFQENLLQNIFGSEWSGNMMTQNYGPE